VYGWDAENAGVENKRAECVSWRGRELRDMHMSRNKAETASKFVVQRKSAICLTTNESRRVYRDTTTELIVACSS